MIRCTVGVMAHNEARNVLRTLHALLAQQVETVEIVEIIVIASGCTDSTVEIAEGVASAHPIVTVDVETHRTGKAAAIRRLMSMARGEIVVLVNADTLPEAGAIEQLVRPFADQSVGMTGGRVIPLNMPKTWLGFTVQMLWHVHHQLALRKAKLGEMVAFRNVIEDFPENTSTDEPALEALIASLGYRLVYAPKAIVYNRGPERTGEFLVQRRRVFAGQVRIAARYGYFTSSMRMRYVLPIAMEALNAYPRFLPWTVAAIAVEGCARLMGLYDAVRGREHVVWRHAASTKAVTGGVESLTMITVRWPPGSLDSGALLRDLQRHSEPAGSIFWWDRSQGEVLLFVGGESPEEWFQERIDRVSAAVPKSHPAAEPLISFRLVKFHSPAVN